jgi:hypothetical protein
MCTVPSLSFTRQQSGIWLAMPLPDYPLTIACRREGYVFRGKPHPDFPSAVAAANAWFADQISGLLGEERMAA